MLTFPGVIAETFPQSMSCFSDVGIAKTEDPVFSMFTDRVTTEPGVGAGVSLIF